MEWIATVVAVLGGLAGLFAAGAKGIAWLRRQVATRKQRRVRERTLESTGELEHECLTGVDRGETLHSIAERLKVRGSVVRRTLRNLGEWPPGPPREPLD